MGPKNLKAKKTDLDLHTISIYPKESVHLNVLSCLVLIELIIFVKKTLLEVPKR